MTESHVPQIGERIRAQRRNLRMTLDELAHRTLLSKSFLSQVERGTTSPSIDSLSLIAQALNVPMFLFFVEEDGRHVVQRRSERRSLKVPDSNFRYESIWFGAHRKMEIIIGRLSPGESSSDHPRSHSAADMITVDESVFVLQGKAEFQLGDEVHILEKGDSAYFAGNVPHRFCAQGEEELILLFAVAPPAVAR